MSDDGLCILLASIIFKILLFPTKFSTDFEVHRNWLAITGSLPWWRWYQSTASSSPWLLDYPPFFAWWQWLLSFPAQLFDAKMLERTALNYASNATIIFQRGSVIFGDLLLAWALAVFERYHVQNNRSQTLLLLLFMPGLIIVDHMHFQYNGLLIGIFVLALLAFKLRKFILGSVLYCLLVNKKHIFLYFAPAITIYVLFGYIFKQLKCKHVFTNSFKVSAAVAAIFCLSLGPFLWIGQGPLLLERLFPLGRGLNHALWAPNFWAIYSAMDAGIVRGVNYIWPGTLSISSRLTDGLVEAKAFNLLPTVFPHLCFVLVLLTQLVALFRLAKRPTPLVFHRSLLISGFAAFLFGWHVHEKAIIPIFVLAYLLRPVGISDYSVGIIYWPAMLSLLPLIQVPMERLIGLVLIIAWSFAFNSESFKPSRSFKMYILVGLVIQAFGILAISHPKLIPTYWEFLPIMASSVFSAVGLSYCFLRLNLEFSLSDHLVKSE